MLMLYSSGAREEFVGPLPIRIYSSLAREEFGATSANIIFFRHICLFSFYLVLFGVGSSASIIYSSSIGLSFISILVRRELTRRTVVQETGTV